MLLGFSAAPLRLGRYCDPGSRDFYVTQNGAFLEGYATGESLRVTTENHLGVQIDPDHHPDWSEVGKSSQDGSCYSAFYRESYGGRGVILTPDPKTYTEAGWQIAKDAIQWVAGAIPDGTQPSMPEEFPRWDVNSDGVVDVGDLVLVGLHYGEDYRTLQAMAALSGVGRASGQQTRIHLEAKNKIHVQGARLLQIDIHTDFANDLYGCQFDLRFDPASLEVVGVHAGEALAQDGASIHWQAPIVDNQKGRLTNATYVRRATKQGIDTSGVLATVIFRAKDVPLSGATRLELGHVRLLDAEVRSIQAITETTWLNWEELVVPGQFALHTNYPNPFNPETWIPYELSESADVTLRIFDAQGHLVRTLAIGYQPAGYYLSQSRAAHWDGRNATGEHVASGTYMLRLQAQNFAQTRRIVVSK